MVAADAAPSMSRRQWFFGPVPASAGWHGVPGYDLILIEQN